MGNDNVHHCDHEGAFFCCLPVKIHSMDAYGKDSQFANWKMDENGPLVVDVPIKSGDVQSQRIRMYAMIMDPHGHHQYTPVMLAFGYHTTGSVMGIVM